MGIPPLSYRQIETILGVPESTCGNIYKHALRDAEKKAAAKRQDPKDSAIRSLHREPEDVEVFLAGIDAQLDSLYTEPSQEVESDAMEIENDASGEIGFLDLISAECLDVESRSGRPQALSEEEKDHLIAITKRDWGTRHMSLRELVPRLTFFYYAHTAFLFFILMLYWSSLVFRLLYS